MGDAYYKFESSLEIPMKDFQFGCKGLLEGMLYFVP